MVGTIALFLRHKGNKLSVMRYATTLLLLLILNVSGIAQSDSLLTSFEWVEDSSFARAGYVLRLQPHGAFEEDAGEDFTRSSRYLLGRWAYVDSTALLTLSVDYFMGKNMVNGRYRDGQDFYLDYKVVKISDTALQLKDLLTGKVRSFTSRPVSAGPDASERRKPKPTLTPELTLPQLPKGWGG